MRADGARELRVLIFAPVGRDGALTSDLLTRANIPCHVCGSGAELAESVADGAGAVMLTEEALSNDVVRSLTEVLNEQPAWSDVSILLFAGGDRNEVPSRTLAAVEALRNVTLLDRPVRRAALVTTVRAALRGRRRQYELRDVLIALHKARTDAEQANQLKDEFLAIVSHELRTPLNAILGWVSMLRQARFERGRVDNILGIIERNAKAQAQLIADVLDISRMIGGRVTLRLEPVSLARVICDAADAVRPAAVAKGVALRVDVDEGPVVNADPDRLQQVVWNLLSNACKFTPEGGHIDVGVRVTGAAATITVSDTGVGISPEFLPFVFDRFRQADQGFTRAAGGLGLGLAIAKQLIEMHGGHVIAQSEGIGKGATFEVRLPLVGRGRRRVERTETEETAERPLSTVDLSNQAILVVEDDQATRELLSAILTQAGARVTAVGSAAEAVAQLDIEVPGLVLADIGMPVEDGLSMMRRIRQRSPGRGGLVRAVALSAYARAQDRTAALAAGYDDFLTKPALPVEVVQTVSRWLHQAGATPEIRDRTTRRKRPRAVAAEREAPHHR
jgi:signal transduction histidine kinase/DNA-binding NarL/FixJ family response regulator